LGLDTRSTRKKDIGRKDKLKKTIKNGGRGTVQASKIKKKNGGAISKKIIF